MVIVDREARVLVIPRVIVVGTEMAMDCGLWVVVIRRVEMVLCDGRRNKPPRQQCGCDQSPEQSPRHRPIMRAAEDAVKSTSTAEQRTGIMATCVLTGSRCPFSSRFSWLGLLPCLP